MTIFFFQGDSALVHMHCACNTDNSPTSFLLSHAPNSPSWMHWLQDLGSHTTAWVWVVIWGGIIKCLLTAYFIGNISAKKISKCVYVCQSYSKPKVGRFLRHRVYTRCLTFASRIAFTGVLVKEARYIANLITLEHCLARFTRNSCVCMQNRNFPTVHSI